MTKRDRTIKEYMAKAQKLFPEIRIGSVVSLYNGEEPSSGRISLSNQSDAFKAKFSFNGHLIHYTSLDTLFAVLNSQTFRLYNCFTKNDKREIAFANSELGIGLNDDELIDFRLNNFIASFCEYDMEQQNDDFNMWRLYGRAGKGVGLVFEIANMEQSWNEVYLGKVIYNATDNNNSLKKRFQDFIQFHHSFNNEHALFENTPSILSAIALHFKNEIWRLEKEVRLFAYCPFDAHNLKRNTIEPQSHLTSSTMCHSVNEHGELVSYVSLPLNVTELKVNYEKEFGSELGGFIYLLCHT